ncbi:MAG: response regulator transcription factor [Anaerolineae bacterium]|nr:response regulator transcription factor [Anaerolineae bacterium]
MKLLVIDDEPSLVELLGQMLDQNSMLIDRVETSRGALNYVRKQQPDLILLDDLGPQVDKPELTRKLRKESNAPILILSAVTNPMMVAQALDAGADDYLIKPVSSSILMAYINKYVRRAGLKIHQRVSVT